MCSWPPRSPGGVHENTDDVQQHTVRLANMVRTRACSYGRPLHIRFHSWPNDGVLFRTWQLPMEDKGILIAGYDPQCTRDHFVTGLIIEQVLHEHILFTCFRILCSYICCTQWIHLMCVRHILTYSHSIHLMCISCVLTYNPLVHLMCIPYMRSIDTLDACPTCTCVRLMDILCPPVRHLSLLTLSASLQPLSCCYRSYK
jgi:hypothetical protein